MDFEQFIKRGQAAQEAVNKIIATAHTPGSMRAADMICRGFGVGNFDRESRLEIAGIIDKQTALPDLLDALKQLVEWGEMIEKVKLAGTDEATYGPVKAGRAALRRVQEAG